MNEMNFSSIIVNILNREGKVAIPGLGSFTCQHRPATIDLENHRFSPPSRRLVFSTESTEGLNLVTELVRLTGQDQGEAEQQVRTFVQQVLQALRQEEGFEFPGLGGLRLMKSGNMVFLPDLAFEMGGEFLGLEPFTLDPILSSQNLDEPTTYDGIADSQPQEPADVIASANTEQKLGKKISRSALVFGWLMALLGVAFLSIAYIYRVEIGDLVKSLSPNPPSAPIEHATALPDVNLSYDTVEPAMALADTLLDSGEDTLSPESLEQAPTQVSEPSGPRYYVVAGAFREEDKAVRMVDMLKEKGYSARIFETSPTGLHVVCYGEYPTNTEALDALHQIKQKENASAWIKRVDN